MIGSNQLARTHQRGLNARLAHPHVSLDVFDDDDRVVHDETHGQHDREDREQVQAEAERVHHEARSDERHRHRHERHQRRPHRAHEQEDHDADDQNRFRQRLRDLRERVLHEHGRVIRHLHVNVRRQRRTDALHFVAQSVRDVDLVHARERPHAEVDGHLLAVLGDHVGLFGAKLDTRDVAQPDECPTPIGDDQIVEFFRRAQIGVRQQAHLYEVPFRLAHRGEVIVPPQRRVHVTRREVERGQAIRIDPDAHGDLTAAFHRHALHPRQRRELRLQRPHQPIRHARYVALGRREAQVERRVRPVGALHLDGRRLGLRGQLGANLL